MFPTATAAIYVIRAGVSNLVWSSPFVADQDWSLATVSISQFADGRPDLKIQFKETAGTVANSGWNIDRVIVNSGNDPQYRACGGCGLAPSFAGLVSATDANPCGDTGVTLNWNVAASWGSGGPGTYTVYREATPNFTPSATNRIALGVAGTTYADTTALNGVTLYYLVRAENNETCSTGANNRGVTDANTTYLASRTTFPSRRPARWARRCSPTGSTAP